MFILFNFHHLLVHFYFTRKSDHNFQLLQKMLLILKEFYVKVKMGTRLVEASLSTVLSAYIKHLDSAFHKPVGLVDASVYDIRFLYS